MFICAFVIFLLPEQKKNETKRKFAVCIFLPTPVLFSTKQKELATLKQLFVFNVPKSTSASRQKKEDGPWCFECTFVEKRFMKWRLTLAGVWADTYWSVCRCFSMCFRNHTLCPKLCEESKTFTYHYYVNTLHSLHQYPNIQIINTIWCNEDVISIAHIAPKLYWYTSC